MGGWNLDDLAKMAGGTWNLMLDYVPAAVFECATDAEYLQEWYTVCPFGTDGA